MKIEWPTASVLVATIAAIVVAWMTAPEHRVDIVAGVGTIGSFLLALLRPLAKVDEK